MKYLLVDNGSLRAESVLNLRRVARELSINEKKDVMPASLLHSSKVPAEDLGGEPAVNFEPRMRRLLQSGEREFTVVPFFFGPTMAILDYMPRRIAALKDKYGAFDIRRTAFLFDEQLPGENDLLVSILADNVRRTVRDNQIRDPKVILVDHGSPVRPVTEVRNMLAGMLRRKLGGEVASVDPASMERRPGEQYDFNEPLLENRLAREDMRQASAVVAMLFLSPGRHAGPGGDVDQICSAAKSRYPGLSTWMTDLVGTHPGITDLLTSRVRGRRLPLE